MNFKFPVMAALACITAIAPFSSHAQANSLNPADPPHHKQQFKEIHLNLQKPALTPEFARMLHNQATTGQTIPMWNYSTVAQDGKTYSGSMVGRSPFAHGHRVTTIPTMLIPVAFTFQDSGETFDPSQPNGCSPDGSSVIRLIQNSPLIGTPNFTMNGVNVGVAQYTDAFQRAAFWSKVAGTPYHTTFGTSPKVLSTITVTVPTANGQTVSAGNFGGCSDLGEIDNGWLQNLMQKTIMPGLASEGVNPTMFPQFIFDSVVQYENNDPSQCCVLGFHDAFMNNGVFQTYSVNAYDNSGAFGGNNTSTMAHEIAEWLDDPAINNGTPAWGAEGQVTSGNCQNNLEVGDPLSPSYPTPTNPFHITNTSTGVTYTLQELAFYSWFLGGTSLGAGGKYSDNGTFKGYAKACPSGGTN